MDAFFERVILLGKEQLSDGSRRVLLLGETAGKFYANAAAVAQSKKRFPSGIEHFCLYESEIAPSKLALKTAPAAIKSARPLVAYSLARDMKRYYIASRVTEIIGGLLPLKKEVVQASKDETAGEYATYFNLLITTYATLEKFSAEHIDEVHAWALWRALILMGYGLDPYRCPKCSSAYSPENGAMHCEKKQGIFCKKCADSSEGGSSQCGAIPMDAVAFAQKITTIAIPIGFGTTVSMPTFNQEVYSELLRVLNAQIKCVLPAPLKSDALFKPK